MRICCRASASAFTTRILHPGQRLLSARMDSSALWASLVGCERRSGGRIHPSISQTSRVQHAGETIGSCRQDSTHRGYILEKEAKFATIGSLARLDLVTHPLLLPRCPTIEQV